MAGARRYLIVNADDFGQSPAINRGIMMAHEGGLVTSASLMVCRPDAHQAAEYGARHPALSLGLHADLGEWAYQDGAWTSIYEVPASRTVAAIRAEIRRQLAQFRDLTGREPSHLDSHQHRHHHEPLRSIVLEAARRLEIPVRHYCPYIRYCGDFYGQTPTGTSVPDAITPAALIALLKALPPGVTELSCHPADGSDLSSMYATERSEELRTLCSAQVRSAVAAEGVELCSFLDVAARLGSTAFHAVPGFRGSP